MAVQSYAYQLLAAASATGAAVAVDVPGDYCFAVNGTFGGATVGLDMMGPDGVNWMAVKDAIGAIGLTAAGALIVTLPIGSYRATIAGGSGVSVTANLKTV